MHRVTITGLNRMTSTCQDRPGVRVLAHFDCIANGIGMKGCALMQTQNHGLIVSPPKGYSKGTHRALTLEDVNLRKAMRREAAEVFKMMGGTEEQLNTRPTSSPLPEDDQTEEAPPSLAEVAFLAPV